MSKVKYTLANRKTRDRKQGTITVKGDWDDNKTHDTIKKRLTTKTKKLGFGWYIVGYVSKK